MGDGMATLHPETAEVRGFVTITLPTSTIERLRPLASRRLRSSFIEQAINGALDRYEATQATEDREHAAAV
jgi:predicted transcriptional regulator